MKRLFSNLRFRLALLVLLSTLPALLITLQAGLGQRQLARTQAVNDAYRFTRLAADYQIALVQQTRSLLQFLANGTPVLRDRQACPLYLQNLHSIYPQYNSLVVASLAGEIYCSSPPLEQAIQISDRDYFQEALRSRGFVIGKTITGRLTGRLIQPYAMPFFDEQGQPQGILLVTVNLDGLAAYAASLQLPPRSAVLVIDNEGTVITRYPLTEEYVGKDLRDAPIVQDILAQHGEGNVETQGVDGVMRLYAFTPVQATADQELFITVGVPVDIAYQNADRLMRQTLFWIGLAAVVALLVALLGGDVLFLRVVSLTAERDLAEKRLQDANNVLEQRVIQRTEELAQVNEQLQQQLRERESMVQQLQQQESHLRAAMTRLQQSNRDLQDFAYVASHDMQEPLRKIQAFSERLEGRYASALNEEGRDFLQRINASASRMQMMINALLTYSWLNSRGRDFTSTSLSAVLAQVINDLELRIQETGAQILIDDLPSIEADPAQISQLFTNLVSNAIKFQRPGIAPIVQIREESGSLENYGKIVIAVEDNGIGFEEKYLDRIFKPFQRLHNRSEYEGSGIGLAICRKIVERMNGSITATSIPGQGSRFLITLPRKQTQERPD